MPKLFTRLSTWTHPVPVARPGAARSDPAPAQRATRPVYDDPAYESFFAEYRQVRGEPTDRAAR
jgi:hypothetical protein